MPAEPVIETDRLILRRMTFEDLDALHRVWGDPSTMVYYPAPLGIDQCRQWIERTLERYEIDGFGLWTMTFSDDGQVIGDCGVTYQPVEDEMLPEIGYHLQREFWGCGFATEAARACLAYAHEQLGLASVVSIIRDINLPSQRVAERIGMTPWKQIARADIAHIVYRHEV